MKNLTIKKMFTWALIGWAVLALLLAAALFRVRDAEAEVAA